MDELSKDFADKANLGYEDYADDTTTDSQYSQQQEQAQEQQ